MRIVTAREAYSLRLAAPLPPVPVRKGPQGQGQENPGYGQQQGLSSPQGVSGDFVGQDWRKGNGGAFHSPVRPPMSSDIPHPEEIYDPANKRHANALARTVGASEDPEHDPWNVLGGTGQTFEGLVNNHISHQQNMTPEQGYAGRVWYQAAHDATKDLAAKTTGHHGKAVATMSAYSPKTGWDENMEKGHHFLTHYDGSNPNFTVPGMGAHTEAAKAIYHSQGDDWQQALTGPKRSAFAKNILDPTQTREPRAGHEDDAGYYPHPQNPATGEADWRMGADQDSTIDTHHVRMSNTPHGASLADLKYETPKYFGKGVTHPQTGEEFDPSYDLHSRAAWEATRRINAAEPDANKHLVPKQVQAGPWTKFKADVDNAGKGTGGVEPGVRPKGLQDQLSKPKNVGRDPQQVEQEWGEKSPLTNPIPRYERDLGDFWNDPRRPKVDLRQTPNWNRHSSLSPWWDQSLAAWMQAHPQHGGAVDPHLAAFEGPHDNPWSGPEADDLRQGCKFCGAAPFGDHDPHCPINHSDNPEQDFAALGGRPPLSIDPHSIHLNSLKLLAEVKDLLGKGH
jgi:hypothetical protein